MSRPRLSVLVLALTVGSVVGAARAGAQAPANAFHSRSPSAEIARSPDAGGPTRERAAVGVRAPHQEPRVLNEAMRPGHSSAPGVALIVVGAAAILTGLVVGGDAGHAIAVGGAVVGLIGLYQYLQ